MDYLRATNDEELKKVERKMRKVYKQAQDEVQAKLDAYLQSFANNDRKMYEKMLDGKISPEGYFGWRRQQMMVGKRWQDLRDELADRMTNANEEAMAALGEKLPSICAESVNYTMFTAETFAGMDTSFTLWDERTVNRLIKDEPNLLPKARVKVDKDKRWNQKMITSAVTQGILQGESMHGIAGRMMGEVSKGFSADMIKNANKMTSKQVAKELTRRIRNASIRTARTAVTGAENAGRAQGYKSAKASGIDLKQQWLATLDGRTRHEHRQLDGQIRDVGKPFEVDGIKLDFPADPKAPARLVYNCRCTTIAVVNGHAIDLGVRDMSKIDDDYETWKNGKKKEEAAPADTSKRFTSADTTDPVYKKLLYMLEAREQQADVSDPMHVDYNPIKKHTKKMTEDEKIEALAGGDMTQGSCASLALCYIGQKLGYNVLDFRDGESREFFASSIRLHMLSTAKGLVTIQETGGSACTVGNRLLKHCEEGKDYYLCVGRHASIVRKVNGELMYLELQSNWKSGWNPFGKDTRKTLSSRFGASPRSDYGYSGRYDFMIDIDASDFDTEEFRTLLGYINTEESKQKKGRAGHVR